MTSAAETPAIVTYTSTFTGTVSGFSLTTDPDGGERPLASIEVVGMADVPFTSAGAAAQWPSRVRIVRAGRSYFIGEAGDDSVAGWLGVTEADFAFLMQAVAARPTATVRVVGAVDVDKATWTRERFEVDYFELTVF